MTSLKLLFRPSRVEGKEGILYIRVIHDRVARQVNLGCKLRSREWKDGRVDTAAATDAPRRTYLATTTVKARPICCRCSTESVATRAGITKTPCKG